MLLKTAYVAISTYLANARSPLLNKRGFKHPAREKSFISRTVIIFPYAIFIF